MTGLKNRSLIVNSSALFALQIANYILPFILIPFLTKVLGVTYYGVVAFGLSMAQIACIITDFGFNLSATYKISQSRTDKVYVNKIIGGVMACKFFLLIAVFIAFGTYILLQTKYAGHQLFLSLMFLTVLGQTFQPIWFFQGIEQMVYITLYTVTSRIIYVIMVLILVDSPSSYTWIAFSNGIASILAAGTGLYILLYKGYSVRWPGIGFVKQLFQESSTFFLSRAALATYSAGGAFFLGLFSSSAQVAYYSAAEQLYKGARSVFEPVSQALYPHMAQHKNFKLFFKIFSLALLTSTFITIAGIFGGNFFIQLFFGTEFTEAYPILVIFLVTYLISIPSVLLGYPFLGAIGYIQLANRSVIYAGIVQVLLLVYCYLTKHNSGVNIAVTVLLVEGIVLTIRIFWVRRYYRIIKKNPEFGPTPHHPKYELMLFYIKKAFSVPFKILLAYISIFSIRSKHIYVFGAWAGDKFADNPKYLFLQASKIEGITSVWITSNSTIYDTLKAANYKVEMYSSIRGIYYQLRAGVCFTCSHPNDLFIYLLGSALHINLWHGVPLKKIAFDDLKTGIMHQNLTNKFLFKIKEYIYQYPFRNEYVVSTSNAITTIYQGAFHKKQDKVLQLGQPRNDVFFDNSLESDHQSLNKRYILYMPTHRASGKQKFDLEQIFDLKALNQLCAEHDIFFVVKKHYYHNKEVENLTAYSNIQDITQNDFDTQQLLKHSELLITDYSSCYIDYLLLDRPIIFYNFDLTDYRLNDRELYFDYNTFTPGEKVKTFENLLRSLEDRLVNNVDDYSKERHKILDFFYAESNQKQVGQTILNEVTRLLW